MCIKISGNCILIVYRATTNAIKERRRLSSQQQVEGEQGQRRGVCACCCSVLVSILNEVISSFSSVSRHRQPRRGASADV